MKRVVFTGGGTGGHVFPALAIIEELKKDGYEVSWIGSKSGMEYEIVTNNNIKFYSIPSGKLRRYFSFRNFIDIFKIGAGFIKSFFILKRIKPDLIFSKGGYVTVPPIVAGSLLGIHTLTHESDYSPGLATRLNSRFVDKILVPYKATKEFFSNSMQQKVVITGNPVRSDFFNPDIEKGYEILGFDKEKPVILVLGGSLGAKQINNLILESRDELLKKYYIYHQMGERNFLKSDVKGYKSVPFIRENIADMIKAADLIISRSGAGAVWEFVTVGTPSFLIPLVEGSRGDQLLNAEYFKKLGMAKILTGDDVNSIKLLKELENYFKKDKVVMENSIMQFSENSTVKICNLIKELT